MAGTVASTMIGTKAAAQALRAWRRRGAKRTRSRKCTVNRSRNAVASERLIQIATTPRFDSQASHAMA